MTTKLIGLGAGGHAKVIIEVLKLRGEHLIVGLLDPRRELWQTNVLGVPVLGNDNLLTSLFKDGLSSVFIGVGGTGDNSRRKDLYELAIAQGFRVAQIIHPQAIISPSTQLADGLTVMAGAMINAESQLGVNVIVNTGAIVEHGCVVGEHVHIATGAKLASGVQVGDDAHIGLGASVRQGINIGNGAIVGAGAVVVKDVEPMTVVTGVPARVLKKLGAIGTHPANTPLSL